MGSGSDIVSISEVEEVGIEIHKNGILQWYYRNVGDIEIIIVRIF